MHRGHLYGRGSPWTLALCFRRNCAELKRRGQKLHRNENGCNISSCRGSITVEAKKARVSWRNTVAVNLHPSELDVSIDTKYARTSIDPRQTSSFRVLFSVYPIKFLSLFQRIPKHRLLCWEPGREKLVRSLLLSFTWAAELLESSSA